MNQQGNDKQHTSAVTKQQPHHDSTVGGTQQVNYFQFLLQTVKEPDSVLNHKYKGFHMYGIISMSALIVLMILSSIVSTAVVYDGFDWQIGTFSDHLYRPLAYAVPLGILIAVYKWRAEKEGKQRTHNYFIEKLGATFTVPIAFLIISIVLELIERSTYIHAWFSSMAYTFIYVGIFMVTYLFVSHRNLKVASLFLFGYYMAYRLLYMIITG
ncbi:MAG TPA: hypothetical protein VK119_11065 [Bacillota bacterium]|nr:hypothetical protein [Bacillota bacterium]